MTRSGRRWIAWIVVVLVLFTGRSSAVAGEPASGTRPGAEDSCVRLSLRPAPRWSISGAWVERGESLALVDISGAAIVRYDSGGSLGEDVLGDDAEGERFAHPTKLHEGPGGSYVLQDGPTGWIELAPDLRRRRSLELRFWTAAWPGGSGWIGGSGPAAVIGDEIVAIVPAKSGEKVVYALVRIGAEDWSREMAEYPGGAAPEIDGVELPGLGVRAESFFGWTTPTMAAVADRPYVLSDLDDSGFAIYELTPTPRRLKAFPDGFSRTPSFPPSGGRDSTASLYAFLESSKMPRGLYARGSFLFVLTREPAPAGTLWRLHAIDPANDRLVRSLTLPTRANHVYLVPGPKWWGVVEKGAVTGPGQQPIPSVVLVPSQWIEDPSSGALLGELPACPPVSPPSLTDPPESRP